MLIQFDLISAKGVKLCFVNIELSDDFSLRLSSLKTADDFATCSMVQFWHSGIS